MVFYDLLIILSEVGFSGFIRFTESVRSKKDKVCDYCIEVYDE